MTNAAHEENERPRRKLAGDRRRLMKLKCERGHIVAEVVASPEGPTLVVPHVRTFDADENSLSGYSAVAGDRVERLLVNDPDYGNDGLTAACRKCDLDFHLIPHEVQRHYKAEVKHLVVKARTVTRRKGYK